MTDDITSFAPTAKLRTSLPRSVHQSIPDDVRYFVLTTITVDVTYVFRSLGQMTSLYTCVDHMIRETSLARMNPTRTDDVTVFGLSTGTDDVLPFVDPKQRISAVLSLVQSVYHLLHVTQIARFRFR